MEALATWHAAHPDATLAEMETAVPAVAAACPASTIVMLTVSEEEDHVLRALMLSAHGHILSSRPAHRWRRWPR